jgi:hypothetical protein
MIRENRVKYYLAVLLSLATFLVYLPTLRNGFVWWDDNDYIFENPHIRSFDVPFLKWAFFNFYAANWHPLTWLSHATDYAIWGLNPLGHHLMNVILHALNTFLVVITIIKLVESSKKTATTHGQSASYLSNRSILITAGITGLLFGLHPLHVESVAWVSERKDLLCAMFFLLSIMAYTKYVSAVRDKVVRHNSASQFSDKRYLLTIGFFALALLSKPMAISLPFVLLILDWYPFRRMQSLKTFHKVFVEKLPFFVLSIFSSVITVLAQKSSGAVASIREVGLSMRLLVAAKSIVVYLWKIILPFSLIPFYPYQKNISILSPQYFSALVIVICITATCIIVAKKDKLWLSVWAYYIVTLFPVLGIVQVGEQSMADRYTYLTSLAPFLLIGLLVTRVSRKPDSMRKWSRTFKFLGILAVIFALVAMSYLTSEQIGIWRDSITLWTYVIEKEPGKVPRAYKIRGTAFYDNGQFDKAIKDYTEAIALDKKDSKMFINRGLAYLKVGQVDLAMHDFAKACELGDYFGCDAPKYLSTKSS